MRAFFLKSVAAATLALTPIAASAEGPGGSGAPAAGAHSPGAGGADRAAPSGGGAGNAEHHGGGELKGDAPPRGMQRENGANREGAEERAPKSDRPDSGDRMPSGSSEKMQKDRMKGDGGADRAGEGNAESGKSDRAGNGEHGNARNVKITSEQRTKITTSLRSGPAKRIDSVNFSIRIGTAVPRSYHYYPLPPEIIEFVPEYRGYDYILVGDQILIIDPETGAIVDII